LNFKKEILLIIIHIGIGLAISMFKPLSALYSFAIMAIGFWYVFASKNKHLSILIVLAYVAGSDVFLRMTQGLVFYELHKYLLIVFSVIGIFIQGGVSKGYHYIFYILLFMPSIFMGDYSLEDEVRKLVAFNLAGPVSLGVVAFYLYKRKVKLKELNLVLFFFVLPIISMAIYLQFFKASQMARFINTASNFATSGNFGPNQVSTILGVGTFIMLTRLVFTFKFLDKRTIINLILFTFISYRGVITFSRGGTIAAIIASAFFVFLIYMYSTAQLKFRIVTLFIYFFVIGTGVWGYTVLKTNGMISKRYAGENAAGVKKEDISSGRGTLAEYELQAFKENPVFGIGPGKIRKYRYNLSGIDSASHNEITRALAEHGLFGAVTILLLLIVPLLLRFNIRSNVFFYSFFLMWFLTINHSATRIAAPAFMYALSLIDIQYEKNTVRRKSIKR